MRRLLTNGFVASTQFLVDDDVAVVAAEDDAAVSLISDVSMVPQMGRLFALMDSESPFVGLDGHVPDHALRGDWGSAEHLSKTSAGFVRHGRVADGVVMFPGIGEHMAKECNVSYDRVFVVSDSERRSQFGRKVGPVEGECWTARRLHSAHAFPLSERCCVHSIGLSTHSRWLKVATKQSCIVTVLVSA